MYARRAPTEMPRLTDIIRAPANRNESGELRRMVVMGPFYKDVDHVEYQAVGAAGQKRSVSMEEGMRWEGLASAQNDDEVGWFALSLSLSLSLSCFSP